MAIVLPLSTDTLAADNHTLMHNVFAIDSAAPAQSVVVSSSGQVLMNPARLAAGTVVTNSSASLTLTGALMAANTIFQETGTTAATFTLDTGTALSTAIPNIAVGQMIWFVISNASTQTVTLAGATGTTLGGTMTVLTHITRTVYAVNTGSNTWTIY